MQKEEGKIRYTNSVIIFASKKPQKKKGKLLYIIKSIITKKKSAEGKNQLIKEIYTD